MSRLSRLDAAGVLFGLLMYFIWILMIFLIQSFFFAEKYVIQGASVIKIPPNDVFIWLSDGLLVFYLILGHHIFTKKASDVRILRNLFLGFGVWLSFLLILSLFGFSISAILQQSFELGQTVSTSANVLMGYLVMFAICLIKHYGVFEVLR